MDLQINKKNTVYFIGIGGIGMSGLAQIMKNMGFKVQGSDQNKSKNTAGCIKAGIKVYIGHSKKNVKSSTILSYLHVILLILLILLFFCFLELCSFDPSHTLGLSKLNPRHAEKTVRRTEPF